MIIATLLALLLTAGAVCAGDGAPAGEGATMAQIHAECTRHASEEQVLACVQERLPGAVDLPSHLRASMARPQDPAVDAAIEAWWTQAHGAVNAHATRLAATGTSRGLLQAAILWHPRWEDGGEDQPPPLHPRVAEWFGGARAVRPVDPLVDWLDASDCAGSPDTCDSEAARARLLRREPRNTAVHLLELEARHDAGDRAGTRDALADAAAGTHVRSHYLGILRLALDAYRDVEWPAVPEALAGPLAERLGWGDSFDRGVATLVMAISQSTALALPARRALVDVCRPQEEEVATECLAVLEHLAGSSETVIDAGLALRRLVELTLGTPAEAAWRERLRDFHWLYENAARLHTTNTALRVDPAEYAAVFAESGELAAMRMLLEHHGLPLEAPADWLAATGMTGRQVAEEDSTPAATH